MEKVFKARRANPWGFAQEGAEEEEDVKSMEGTEHNLLEKKEDWQDLLGQRDQCKLAVYKEVDF